MEVVVIRTKKEERIVLLPESESDKITLNKIFNHGCLTENITLASNILEIVANDGVIIKPNFKPISTTQL